MLNGHVECVLLESFPSKGQQGHHAGALDGDSQIALMLGADTGHPAGHDLARFGDEIPVAFSTQNLQTLRLLLLGRGRILRSSMVQASY